MQCCCDYVLCTRRKINFYSIPIIRVFESLFVLHLSPLLCHFCHSAVKYTVCSLSRYDAKRAIVRQGQPPHAFYFILSGSGKLKMFILRCLKIDYKVHSCVGYMTFFSTIDKFRFRTRFSPFLAFDFCRFCVVIRVFSSPPQRPMTSGFEGFSIPEFIHCIYFPILILEKELFSMLSTKQGHYWYHLYNVFGMTQSLTGY